MAIHHQALAPGDAPQIEPASCSTVRTHGTHMQQPVRGRQPQGMRNPPVQLWIFGDIATPSGQRTTRACVGPNPRCSRGGDAGTPTRGLERRGPARTDRRPTHPTGHGEDLRGWVWSRNPPAKRGNLPQRESYRIAISATSRRARGDRERIVSISRRSNRRAAHRPGSPRASGAA